MITSVLMCLSLLLAICVAGSAFYAAFLLLVTFSAAPAIPVALGPRPLVCLHLSMGMRGKLCIAAAPHLSVAEVFDVIVDIGLAGGCAVRG